MTFPVYSFSLAQFEWINVQVNVSNLRVLVITFHTRGLSNAIQQFVLPQFCHRQNNHMHNKLLGMANTVYARLAMLIKSTIMFGYNDCCKVALARCQL